MRRKWMDEAFVWLSLAAVVPLGGLWVSKEGPEFLRLDTGDRAEPLVLTCVGVLIVLLVRAAYCASEAEKSRD